MEPITDFEIDDTDCYDLIMYMNDQIKIMANEPRSCITKDKDNRFTEIYDIQNVLLKSPKFRFLLLKYAAMSNSVVWNDNSIMEMINKDFDDIILLIENKNTIMLVSDLVQLVAKLLYRKSTENLNILLNHDVFLSSFRLFTKTHVIYLEFIMKQIFEYNPHNDIVKLFMNACKFLDDKKIEEGNGPYIIMFILNILALWTDCDSNELIDTKTLHDTFYIILSHVKNMINKQDIYKVVGTDNSLQNSGFNCSEDVWIWLLDKLKEKGLKSVINMIYEKCEEFNIKRSMVLFYVDKEIILKRKLVESNSEEEKTRIAKITRIHVESQNSFVKSKKISEEDKKKLDRLLFDNKISDNTNENKTKK